MRDLKDIIKELRQRHGNKKEVAEKIGISSQLLGQYEQGRQEPKVGFYDKWKEVFNEDIRAIMKKETNVSHGTTNHTPVLKDSEKSNSGDPEVYRTIVEGNTEYVLIPRIVMRDTKLISTEQLEATLEQMRSDKRLMEIIVAENAKLMDKIMGSQAQPPAPQKSKNNG